MVQAWRQHWYEVFIYIFIFLQYFLALLPYRVLGESSVIMPAQHKQRSLCTMYGVIVQEYSYIPVQIISTCHLSSLVVNRGLLHDQLTVNGSVSNVSLWSLRLLYSVQVHNMINFQPICGKEAAAHITRPGLFCQTPPRSSGRQLESQIPTLRQPLSGTYRMITPFLPHWLVHCGLRDWVWVVRPHSLLIPKTAKTPRFPLHTPKFSWDGKKYPIGSSYPQYPQSGPTHPKNSTTQHPYRPSIHTVWPEAWRFTLYTW